MIHMKFYIRRIRHDKNTGKDLVAYKHYKCVDGFCPDKSICWKFSKQGARGIIEALNKEFKNSVEAGLMEFDMIPAEES